MKIFSMNILIIEDEYPAAERLEKLLHKLNEPVTIAGILDSVEGAVRWLQTHPAPDLILSDIQLADGLSFEIYEQVVVKTPIIFTTSYDEYAIKAFRVRSIDYLLKPIKFEELVRAMEKYKGLKSTFSDTHHVHKLEQLLDSLPYAGKSFKKRFLVKKGEQLLPISDEEIAYFYTENELVYLMTHQGKKHLIDHTLEQLDALLDTTRFFRINRQFILQLEAIREIHVYFGSRLKLQVHPAPNEEVIVSKGKAKAFKEWLEK